MSPPMIGSGTLLFGKLVLLIEEDGFFANYVGQAIISAGAQILGPARSCSEAEMLLGQLQVVPFAVVVSATLWDSPTSRVGEALVRLNAPLLVLQKSSRNPLPSLSGYDVLPAPFAAYQVVEYLCVLLERSVSAPQTLPDEGH